MKLVGRTMSPFVRRAAVTAHLYELAFESVPLSTVTERDGIKAFNPITRVPVLELDDGSRIVDSSVIIDFFDQQVAPDRRLVAPSGARRSEVLSLTAVALGACEKMILSFYEKNRRPAEYQYAPWVQACDQQALDGLLFLESRLNGRWLAGDDFSHADVAAAIAVATLRRLETEAWNKNADLLPKLCALAERCENMPAFQRVPLS